MKSLITTLVAVINIMSLSALPPDCPDPRATQKKVASSFHSTIMIDFNGDVKYWGDGANPMVPVGTGLTSYVVSPTTLPSSMYAGTPVAVAAGSIGTGSETGYLHQLYLLTTQGLYGWGASNGTINATTGNAAFASIDLPTGVSASDINFIASSGGGIAVITKIAAGAGGLVYIKNGTSAGGVALLPLMAMAVLLLTATGIRSPPQPAILLVSSGFRTARKRLWLKP